MPLFVCVRTQLFVVSAGQLLAEATQAPAVQVCPDVHLRPQAPQSFGLVCVLTQPTTPPQLISPDGQLQTPAAQVAPGWQTFPQAPQLFGSVDSLTQPRLVPQYA